MTSPKHEVQYPVINGLSPYQHTARTGNACLTNYVPMTVRGSLLHIHQDGPYTDGVNLKYNARSDAANDTNTHIIRT